MFENKNSLPRWNRTALLWRNLKWCAFLGGFSSAEALSINVALLMMTVARTWKRLAHWQSPKSIVRVLFCKHIPSPKHPSGFPDCFKRSLHHSAVRWINWKSLFFKFTRVRFPTVVRTASNSTSSLLDVILNIPLSTRSKKLTNPQLGCSENITITTRHIRERSLAVCASLRLSNLHAACCVHAATMRFRPCGTVA